MPTPTFKEALDKLTSRREVAADLTTAQWAEVPLALRERAFFSARVTNAQLLQGLKSRVETLLKPETKLREDGTPYTAGIDPATARLEIKELLKSIGYQPAEEDRGTIKDLSTDARINLQLKQNVESAQGHGNWIQGQQEGVIDAFPAQELYRLEAREEPRDWPTIWNNARGELGDATTAPDARIAMVALKSDPIWTAISAFGVPWPPFDFNSGMWVRDVDRARAEELGLIEPGEAATGDAEEFNARLKASVRDLDPEVLKSLKESLGADVQVKDGAAWWKQDRKGKALAVDPKPKAPTAPARKPGEFPDQLADLEKVKTLGGSTGAELVQDKVTGDQFVLKRGNSAEHLREEFAADAIYRAAGVNVPEARLFESGAPVKLAKYIEGEQLGSYLKTAGAAGQAAALDQVKKHFVADALLGNWDVAGLNLDNLLVDKEGKVWRIDNGGSLRFRAQGVRKTADQWGKVVTELDTLRDAKINAQTARLFAGITEAEIASQVDALAAARGVILEAAPAELRDVLGARLDNLVARTEAMRGPYTAQTAEAVRKARIVGKSLPTDKGDIEDNQVLWWEEKNAAGEPVLRASLKLTTDGSDRLWNTIKDQIAGGAGLFDEDTVFGKIKRAAVTVNHHQKDGAYNQSTLADLSNARKLIETAIAAKVIERSAAAQYFTWMTEIEAAAAARAAAPMVSKLNLKIIEPARAGNLDVRKVKIEYVEKTIERGFAQGGAKAILETPGYEIRSGGAVVKFKPFTPGDHSHYTLQGRVEVELPGTASAATLKEASATLAGLGVDMAPASLEYQKAVHIYKGLNLRRDLLTAKKLTEARGILADTALTDAQKAERLEEIAKKSGLEYKGGAKAAGVENGFGEGHRSWWRWDVTREQVEQEMKDYVLTHSSSTTTTELLDAWLGQGGVATPTAERIRKGVSLTSGMSVSSDLENGTSDYLFTRISHRNNARGEWMFKAGNLARMDALPMKHDWLEGEHHIEKEGVRRKAAKTIQQFKEFASYSDNETLLKHGVNLLDELDGIRAKTLAEKDRLLKVFKKHKITHLNDGRAVADIIHVK